MTRITVTLHEDKHTFLSLSHLVLRMRNVAYKRKNQNAHFAFNNFFSPRKSCSLWDNVEKYRRAGQAADESVAYADSMLDTRGYKHTLGICNVYCFSTATMVARSRVNVTLYVNCLAWIMPLVSSLYVALILDFFLNICFNLIKTEIRLNYV